MTRRVFSSYFLILFSIISVQFIPSESLIDDSSFRTDSTALPVTTFSTSTNTNTLQYKNLTNNASTILQLPLSPLIQNKSTTHTTTQSTTKTSVSTTTITTTTTTSTTTTTKAKASQLRNESSLPKVKIGYMPSGIMSNTNRTHESMPMSKSKRQRQLCKHELLKNQ